MGKNTIRRLGAAERNPTIFWGLATKMLGSALRNGIRHAERFMLRSETRYLQEIGEGID